MPKSVGLGKMNMQRTRMSFLQIFDDRQWPKSRTKNVISQERATERRFFGQARDFPQLFDHISSSKSGEKDVVFSCMFIFPNPTHLGIPEVCTYCVYVRIVSSLYLPQRARALADLWATRYLSAGCALSVSARERARSQAIRREPTVHHPKASSCISSPKKSSNPSPSS